MSGHEQPLVSVLVPARNEERTLPTTLPAILKAARELPHPAEVLVITPPDSPAYAAPPLCDPILTWLPTPRSGKFNALRIGADAAQGEFLLLVDADVVMNPDTFRILAEPMLGGSAARPMSWLGGSTCCRSRPVAPSSYSSAGRSCPSGPGMSCAATIRICCGHSRVPSTASGGPCSPPSRSFPSWTTRRSACTRRTPARSSPTPGRRGAHGRAGDLAPLGTPEAAQSAWLGGACTTPPDRGR
jgi:hypothetical protein